MPVPTFCLGKYEFPGQSQPILEKFQIRTQGFVPSDKIHGDTIVDRVNLPIGKEIGADRTQVIGHGRPGFPGTPVITADRLIERISLEAKFEVAVPDVGSDMVADERRARMIEKSLAFRFEEQSTPIRAAKRAEWELVVLRSSDAQFLARSLILLSDRRNNIVVIAEPRKSDFDAGACRFARFEEDESVAMIDDHTKTENLACE